MKPPPPGRVVGVVGVVVAVVGRVVVGIVVARVVDVVARVVVVVGIVGMVVARVVDVVARVVVVVGIVVVVVARVVVVVGRVVVVVVVVVVVAGGAIVAVWICTEAAVQVTGMSMPAIVMVSCSVIDVGLMSRSVPVAAAPVLPYSMTLDSVSAAPVAVPLYIAMTSVPIGMRVPFMPAPEKPESAMLMLATWDGIGSVMSTPLTFAGLVSAGKTNCSVISTSPPCARFSSGSIVAVMLTTTCVPPQV
jgi:hypothetical protein